MAKRNWRDEMIEAVRDFTEDEIKQAAETIKEVAHETRDMLKRTSPKDARGSKRRYADTWEVETKKGHDAVTYTVCNPENYQLTHLLEKGHQSYNQYGGPYKRVRAKRHIKKAEVWGNTQLLARLKKEL